MLPGSQKGEETAQILSTAIVVVALATRGSLAMIAFTKGNRIEINPVRSGEIMWLFPLRNQVHPTMSSDETIAGLCICAKVCEPGPGLAQGRIQDF